MFPFVYTVESLCFLASWEPFPLGGPPPGRQACFLASTAPGRRFTKCLGEDSSTYTVAALPNQAVSSTGTGTEAFGYDAGGRLTCGAAEATGRTPWGGWRP